MHDLKHWITEIARPSTRIDADLVLRNAGYQRLNKGAFGAVYQKPGKPYVLKVFAANDVPYIDFIKLAQTYNNTHFPKFFGKIVHVTPQYCAIRMESLTPYRYDETLINRYLMYRDYKPDDPNSYFAMQIGDAFEWMEFHPDFQAACDLIIDHLLPKHPLDIKQNNLMMRGDTIVITDPVKGADADIEKLPPVPEYETPVEPPKFDKTDDDLLRQLGVLEGWEQHTEISQEKGGVVTNVLRSWINLCEGWGDDGGPSDEYRANIVRCTEDEWRLPHLHEIVPPDQLHPMVKLGLKNIMIYRAAPDGVTDIRPGDWVALSKSYAAGHMRGASGHILSKRVPAMDVAWAGTDMNEYYYVPHQSV